MKLTPCREFINKSMVIMVLLISACSDKTSEKPNISEIIKMTSESAASTIVAETRAVSSPIDVSSISSATAIPTIQLTETPYPTPTLEQISQGSPTSNVSGTAQSTPSHESDPCNQTLTSWEGPSANLDFYYDYSPQNKKDNVVISIWVMSDRGECGFLADLSSGPIGQYTVTAYIDGAKSFKVHGSFRISGGSWKIIIKNETVTANGSCHPNC